MAVSFWAVEDVEEGALDPESEEDCELGLASVYVVPCPPQKVTSRFTC